MPSTSDRAPQTFVFLLVEGLSMMSLASAIEPLRSLNRLLGQDAYRWRLASVDGNPVSASNGIALAAENAASAIEGADILFVCGGLRVRPQHERRYLGVLRRAVRQRVALGSLSTGAYLLARAGLLTGYRCTIHWENRAAFQEEFPDLACTDKIYEIDRDRLTCSGGTAAMDLMLRLIADRHGRERAQQVANQFHHERIRDAAHEQRGGRPDYLVNVPPMLKSAIRAMAETLENPLPIARLAVGAGISARQLERLFLRYVRMTPARYYIALRVDRARELLIYSDLPVLDIAVATGFTSSSHFSQWFRRLHGVRPSELRSRAQQPP